MIKARVLVVEDERIVALDIQSRLRELGYDVPVTVATGERAIRKAEELRPNLVLMDIRLAGEMDGVEAAQHIRAHFNIPVIYLTAYADVSTLERAKITEPFGYILKPFEERELHTAIEMALYRHEMETKLKAHAADLERANRRLSLINKVIAASADALEPQLIIKIVCRELAQVLDVPYAAAALLDEEKVTARVVGEFEVDSQMRTLNATLHVAGTPLIQYLLEHQEPLVVMDFHKDPRLASLRDLVRQRGIFSLLLLPLVVGGEVVGGLGLVAAERRHFSAEDVQLAWSVTGQLAGALARIWLNEERHRLDAAIEQTAEGVIITDTQGTIVYVNPAFERITGYNCTEVVGQNPRVLKSGKQDAAVYEDLWSHLEAGEMWQGRLVNRKKDGTFYTAEATITPVHNGRGRVVNYVSVQRDVTHELQLEEQYRQALKMEAVGRLAAGIAHDFNNLLTAINGYAMLMEMELGEGDPVRRMAKNIVGAGERAAELTRQLLAFSRKQVIDPMVLSLNEVVANMIDMLQRTIGEHIEFQLDLASDLWLTKVDPVQIERVIVNLAVNARDAMLDGGRLILRTANVTIKEPIIAYDLESQPGEYTVLSVLDTGIGMSKEVKAHLFEPFFTTKEVGQGTGLGLATVYGIVKQSEGTICLHSVEGQGTTFEMYFPRIEEAAPVTTEVAPAEDTVRSGKETILLVEDNEAVRDLAYRVLKRQGYTLLQAEDGQQARQLAASHRGSIHLLLTDVIMPNMNGRTLADYMVDMWPELRVLYMSGYTDDAIAYHGVLDEGVDFLPKPFRPADLARKVRTVLDR
jgi:PAS domain S-box-containing protein